MSHVGALALVLAAKKSSGSSSSFLLILIVGFGALWYFFLRPQQAKARKAREQTKAFEVGDEIVTVGGIVGTVVDLEGDRVTILSGAGGEDGAPTRLVLVRQAIARKAEPSTPDSASDDDAHEDPDEDDDAHEDPDEGTHDAVDDDDAPGPPGETGNGRGRGSFWRGRKGNNT